MLIYSEIVNYEVALTPYFLNWILAGNCADIFHHFPNTRTHGLDMDTLYTF